MKYCPTSTVVRNPICLVVITFQFVLQIFAIVILYVQDHHHSKACLSWSHLAQTKNSIVLSQRVPRSIVIGFIFFAHFCDCTVKTELIYRSNCAKNSFNRFQVGTIVYRQFSTTFAFKHSSGQWTRGSEDWVSHSPCGRSLLIEYHFFSDPGPRNDHCPAPNLFAKRETSWAFDSHSFLLSLDHHEMSLNINMKMIRPVNFSGVTLNLKSNSWTLWLSGNVVNPGKIFHSNSIGSPSILSKALFSGELLNHVNLSYHVIFDWGFSFIFPRHNTESENT